MAESRRPAYGGSKAIVLIPTKIVEADSTREESPEDTNVLRRPGGTGR